jgi:serine protease Do
MTAGYSLTRSAPRLAHYSSLAAGFLTLAMLVLANGQAWAQEQPTMPTPVATTKVDSAAESAAKAPLESPESDAIDPRLAKIFAGANPAGVEDLRLMQEHVRKISERLQKATVGVQVGAAQGSGVIINKEGYVLTAAHVSGQPKRQVLFQLYDGRKLFGETLGLDRGTDGGLMKITEGKDFPYLEMGDSGKLRSGQWVLATGHPGGYQSDRKPVLRLGRILHVEGNVLTTDCTLVGGDSGGPLFDMQGRVIGINSRIATPLNANMHVPVDTFKESWDRMEKAEAWGHFPGQEPFLGVRGEKDAKNAKLAHVYPNSPAEKAGLKVGDIVEMFGDKAITDFSSLSTQVQERNPGDRVKLKVKRGEETLELRLVLGKKGE